MFLSPYRLDQGQKCNMPAFYGEASAGHEIHYDQPLPHEEDSRLTLAGRVGRRGMERGWFQPMPHADNFVIVISELHVRYI